MIARMSLFSDPAATSRASLRRMSESTAIDAAIARFIWRRCSSSASRASIGLGSVAVTMSSIPSIIIASSDMGSSLFLRARMLSM